MKGVYGWAGVRYVITKFSRMDSLPNFVTHGAPLRALRAREPRYNFTLDKSNHATSAWQFGEKNHVLKFETLNLFQNNRVNSLSLLFCHRDGH